MTTVLVIAPHPDDETLGCGGAILRHRHAGDDIHWLIVTSIIEGEVFKHEQVAAQEREIAEVASRYRFQSVNCLRFPTTRLDTLPQYEIVAAIKKIFQLVNPEIIYLPYRGDVHTDHKMAFDAAISCTKWFRQSSVKRVLAYETLSETEFGINPDCRGFQPNVFVNISEFLEEKLAILGLYFGEMGVFPFPRSVEAVRALATLRGANAGCSAAEAFMLLKEIV
ncbi:MAG TPA: PIG-L deacetylase family protein [Nitrospirota bacterium]|nr:PIG-L deacetylase family protein [Nitrospirota bacterium]